MSNAKHGAAIAGSLLFVVFLWGGSNTGTKWLVGYWPPISTGSVRFLLAGLLLLAILRLTSWLGKYQAPTPEIRRLLWWRGGLSLALYIVVFNWAMRLTAASHVVLYLGASPVWVLLWEELPERSWTSARRYGAASLAVAGVLVLLWPALWHVKSNLSGELLGLASSIFWANFAHQSRTLSLKLSGSEVASHTMWMAGLLLLPLAMVELITQRLAITGKLCGVMALCIILGSVVPYALWNHALRHTRTSKVMLFNNLIPISTMSWAWFCLGEAVTRTFWISMLLVASGVILGQTGSRQTTVTQLTEPEL